MFIHHLFACKYQLLRPNWHYFKILHFFALIRPMWMKGNPTRCNMVVHLRKRAPFSRHILTDSLTPTFCHTKTYKTGKYWSVEKSGFWIDTDEFTKKIYRTYYMFSVKISQTVQLGTYFLPQKVQTKNRSMVISGSGSAIQSQSAGKCVFRCSRSTDRNLKTFPQPSNVHTFFIWTFCSCSSNCSGFSKGSWHFFTGQKT